MAMHQYVIAHIARWRRFRALLEDTNRRHQASIASNRRNWSLMCRFFTSFSLSTCIKRLPVESKAPVFNRGITVVGCLYSVQYKSIFGVPDKVRRDMCEEARPSRLDFQRDKVKIHHVIALTEDCWS